MADSVFPEFTWIGSIIHLTDVHLFGFNSDGTYADPVAARERFEYALELPKMAAPLKNRVRRELVQHDHTVWDVLKTSVVDLVSTLNVESSGSPVIVLQSGDVTLVGALQPFATGYDAYPEFFDLHQLRDAVLAAGGHWAETFGNHDVWPGKVPGWPTAPSGPIATVEGFETDDWPALSIGPFEVYRIDTSHRHWLRGTVLARGRVNPWPDSTRNPLDELRRLGRPTAALPVRIALMHHPPHRFDSSLEDALTTSAFSPRDATARALDAAGVSLVVTGHRHRLNPSPNERSSTRQDPLPHHMGQLVAEVPSRRPEPGGRHYSFSVYRLLLSPNQDQLRVDRVVFRYDERRQGARIVESFVAQPSEILFPSLRLMR